MSDMDHMSNDIVVRLRHLIKPGNCEADSSVIDAMEIACSVIERLRATHSNDGVIISDARVMIGELRATNEMLRSVAGAISIEDVTFDQIKKDARS